jgi:hypothetical protein
MIEVTSQIDIRDFFGLRVLEELGFGSTVSRRYSLEAVVETTVGIVECLDGSDISALVVAGGTPTADVYATRAWVEWKPSTIGHHAAALAVIARLSEMTV